MRRLSTASFKLSVAPKSGADATTYWLVPSVTQVKRKADGTHLPEYVTCESKSKTGEDSPVSGVGTIKYAIIYATGNTSADTVYQSRITITADMAGISFRLYVGGQKVDEKTVLVVDDGEKGKDGLPGPAGERGRLPFPAGKWDANTTYTATDDITPIVYYEDGKTYYVMRKNGSVTGLNPVEDCSNPAGDPTWMPFENYKAIFTEILMANWAKLASAVFHGDYMFSQEGIDANGNKTYEYKNFNPSNPQSGDFRPNLAFNLRTGDQYTNGGHTYGFATNTPVHADSTIEVNRVSYSKVNILFDGESGLVLPNDKKFDGVEFVIISTTAKGFADYANIWRSGGGDTGDLYTGIYYKGSEIRTCFMHGNGSFLRLLAYWTGRKLKYYVVGHSDNFVHIEPVLDAEGIEVPAGPWFVDRPYLNGNPVRVYYPTLPAIFLALAVYTGKQSPNVSDFNFTKPT